MYREKKQSCTTCRQGKFRCDQHDKYPAPCSRCAAKGVRCEVQSDFKRTRVRGRLEALTRENQALKQGRAHSPPTQSDPDPLECHKEAISNKSLEIGGLVLSEIDVTLLANHFLIYYHPHLPLLDFGRLDTFEPLLLWTILLISCQHHGSLFYMFPTIRESQQKLLQQTVLQTQCTQDTIQALLLLCVWPLPVEKQHWDPSWRYCSLAIAAAQELGLHTPESQSDDLTTLSSASATLKPWTACVLVAMTLSLDIGLPSAVESSLYTLTKAKVIEPLATHIQIRLRHSYHHTSTASNDIYFTKASIQTTMRELARIQTEGGDCWTDYTRLEFLGAQLRIYLHHLQVQSSMKDETHLYNQMWYSTLEIALQISNTLNTMLDASSANSSGVVDKLLTIHTLPKHYMYIQIHAAFALLKFLALRISTSESDSEMARNGIRLFYENFQKMSTGPKDGFDRLSRIIFFLAHAEKNHELSLRAEIKTRSAMSVAFEMVRERNSLRDRTALSSAETPLNIVETTATGNEGQNDQPFVEPSITAPALTWDPMETQQGLESWTDPVFNDLQDDLSSNEWLQGLWFDETGILFPARY